MEEIRYVDRKNTDCKKWDGQTDMFGEEGLHAMWVADMDFRVPQCVVDALQKYVSDGVFGYYKIPEAYGASYISWEKKRHGLQIEREWIRFSPGVVAGLNWLIQILSEPGDAVIVNTPVYYPFLDAVRNNGRQLVCSDLLEQAGAYQIDYEDFEQKLREYPVKIFVLCSPHNPVGRVWKKEELEQVFELCKKYDVFIISDEIHHDLILEGYQHCPSLTISGYEDRMAVLTAPSKTFNLAGLQNSMVLLPDENVREKWDAYTLANRVQNGNSFGYIAARAAYEGGEEWLNSVLKQVKNNYEYLRDMLAVNLPETILSPLEGTYLCWINLAAYLMPDQMKEILQKKCRLAVDYGEWFGGERYKSWIRMNLATSLENVDIGGKSLIETLRRF